MRLLIQFTHGLGDAVQLTSVVRQLRRVHPDWTIDVAALKGKASALASAAHRVHTLGEEPPAAEFDRVVNLDWWECGDSYGDSPSTKVEKCLREVFQIDPAPGPWGYEIDIGKEAGMAAAAYLQSIGATQRDDGRWNAVAIHYEGNTATRRKNLTHEQAKLVCDQVQLAGCVPVILDWDRRSPLPDGKRIHCPDADNPLWHGYGTGDAERIAALVLLCRAAVVVDSGPGHVAAATDTPTLMVWVGHHPVHYCAPSDNVLHLVPASHADMIHHRSAEALEFFQRHYRLTPYDTLAASLVAQVNRLLGLPETATAAPLRSKAYNENYYQEHRSAGLDYTGFGGWQQEYGRWLVEALGWKMQRVLDVGCACGAILRGLGQAGAVVQGVDVSEHMINLGRRKWPDMTPLLHTCDAVNLHLFRDGEWDGLHSAQVAEHWKPELVPFILCELARVTRPGGLFFAAFDTEEMFARQGRNVAMEDPTHVCIKPMAWWHEQLAAAGWELCTDAERQALATHPRSYLRRYDWDWFLARRSA